MLHVVPHISIGLDLGVSEEGHGGAPAEGAVRNLLLPGEVLGTLYGCDHLVHGQEGGQVGCVGADDDQGEEPPDSSHYTGAGSLGYIIHHIASHQLQIRTFFFNIFIMIFQ